MVMLPKKGMLDVQRTHCNASKYTTGSSPQLAVWFKDTYISTQRAGNTNLGSFCHLSATVSVCLAGPCEAVGTADADGYVSFADPDEGMSFDDPNENPYLDDPDEGVCFADPDEGVCFADPDEGVCFADPDEGAPLGDWETGYWDYLPYQHRTQIHEAAIAKQKPTAYINRKPAANLKRAIKVARAIGKPINQMISVTCAGFECAENEISLRLRSLISGGLTPWIGRPPRALGRKSDGPSAYVWTIENPNSTYNFHLLVHIPPDRLDDFANKLECWIRKYFGDLTPRTLHMQSAYNPEGAAKYLLKGINQEEAENYGIRFFDQGTVVGKRSGFSEGLGPTARKALEAANIMEKPSAFYPKKGAYPSSIRRASKPLPAGPSSTPVHSEFTANPTTFQRHPLESQPRSPTTASMS